MRVAVLHRPGEIRLAERAVPRPGPGHVLVRVAAVGVCGSDTHYYEHGRIGSFVVEAPLVLGHEPAGTITEVGEGVPGERLGQRVSIEPGVPDLTCPQCLAGRYNLCPGMRFFATPPVDGAFAEYVVVHAAFAHPVPDSISDDAAALLEPLSVAIWACRKARIGAGSRVLVTGAGPIGLAVTQTARAFGATDIVVSDVNPARLRLAAELGATAMVDTGPSDRGRADLAAAVDAEPEALVECSGNPRAAADGLRVLAPAGRAVLVGAGSDELAIPLAVVQRRELEITGTFRYANTWPTAIALVSSGRVDVERLVTGHYRLAEAELALTAARRDPASVKAVVRPQE